MSITIGSVTTFPGAACDRAQAVKVLEEAAEMFEAVDWYRNVEDDEQELADFYRDELVDECADVIQAVCNLLAGLGVADMTAPMAACEYRNRKRGRF